MWRRVNKENLMRAAEIGLGQHHENRTMNVWTVCEDYEVYDEAIVAKYPHFDPKNERSIAGESGRWRGYRPLEETSDLFLKLARLHDEPNFVEAALDFSRAYGMLSVVSVKDGLSMHRMSLRAFQAEAKRAWKVLKLYETVLNSDAVAAQSILYERQNEQTEVVPGSDLEEALFEESGKEGLEEFVLYSALDVALELVNETVRDLCHLEARIFDSDLFTVAVAFPTDPSVVKSAWRFDNLLGAAYLQMYWLMTSGGTIARCDYCGRVMSLTRPHPEGRKRRRDKRFCDDACRQAHHRAKRKS